MGRSRMIRPIAPVLIEPKDREEVRKALIDLSNQVNRSIDGFRIVLYGTGSPPDPSGYPDGTLFFKY